jgi:hypothetical protein
MIVLRRRQGFFFGFKHYFMLIFKYAYNNS